MGRPILANSADPDRGAGWSGLQQRRPRSEEQADQVYTIVLPFCLHLLDTLMFTNQIFSLITAFFRMSEFFGFSLLSHCFQRVWYSRKTKLSSCGFGGGTWAVSFSLLPFSPSPFFSFLPPPFLLPSSFLPPLFSFSFPSSSPFSPSLFLSHLPPL